MVVKNERRSKDHKRSDLKIGPLQVSAYSGSGATNRLRVTSCGSRLRGLAPIVLAFKLWDGLIANETPVSIVPFQEPRQAQTPRDAVAAVVVLTVNPLSFEASLSSLP